MKLLKGEILLWFDETISNIALWLNIDVKLLKMWNNTKKISFQEKMKLYFVNISKEDFQKKRINFHRNKYESFFKEKKIVHLKNYIVQKENNIDVPKWLLYCYNPQLYYKDLTDIKELLLPVIKDKVKK